MANPMANPQLESWPRRPEAARFFRSTLDGFAHDNPPIRALAQRLLSDAGIDLGVLVDHWVLPANFEANLMGIGMERMVTDHGDEYWKHLSARLPRVRTDDSLPTPQLAIGVENVDLFVRANQLSPHLHAGDPGSEYEEARCRMASGELVVVSRRGYDGFRPGTLSMAAANDIEEARKAFRSRQRSGDEAIVQRRARITIETAAGALGVNRAVDEFFAVEREFYMTRNRAARWQFGVQQRLGLGWSNHDHHTYRSSRTGFRGLMDLWRRLGFMTRERFYAGAEAGWGAQILEHPVSRVILFCDLDLAPDELSLDFEGEDLLQIPALGTIGLWCELHGSSIACAGMHHLEAEYDFDHVRELLNTAGFAMMPPFTDLPMLKQAFTEPEIWPVACARVETLLNAGSITPGQAARFRTHGAAGSHLEVLQRWEGFKGFNKTGVSAVIRDTDARG